VPALAELSESRELLANLTSRELRGKYKRSVLGWSWSLINPLVTMGIFYVVFGVILGAGKGVEGHPSGLANFALYLAIGLLPWGFLANGMTGSIGSLIANANLVKKVYFRREILVFSAVGAFLVTFLIEMLVLCVVLLVVGNNILPWLPVVIAVIAVQTLFVTGMGLTVSVLNVYFRDTQHFLSIFLQLWFYATPIVYPLALVRDKIAGHPLFIGSWHVPMQGIYEANPMVRFVKIYHALLYDLRAPAWGDVAYVVTVAVVVLLIGYRIFLRFEPRLAEEL
jgi:ABC-2 type transport system permease protein